MNAVIHSEQAVTCPDCRRPTHDIVFLLRGGARCVVCNDSEMVEVVRRWQNGDLQDVLAEGLQRYLTEEIL